MEPKDIITIKEYVDCIFAEREKQMNIIFASHEKALELKSAETKEHIRSLIAIATIIIVIIQVVMKIWFKL